MFCTTFSKRKRRKNLETLASPDAFKAVEYYIHQITSPRENRIVKETDSLSYERTEQSSSLETVPFESQDSAGPFRDLDT